LKAEIPKSDGRFRVCDSEETSSGNNNRMHWQRNAMEKKIKVKSFANVWDAIMDTPEEVAATTTRSDLLITLTEHVKAWKLTQAAAAKRLDITQPPSMICSVDGSITSALMH
jgi:predicted XRE-type DNA-binding protein